LQNVFIAAPGRDIQQTESYRLTAPITVASHLLCLFIKGGEKGAIPFHTTTNSVLRLRYLAQSNGLGEISSRLVRLWLDYPLCKRGQTEWCRVDLKIQNRIRK
jgi:hypothetical protein